MNIMLTRVLLSQNTIETLPYDYYGFNENYYSCQGFKIEPHLSRATVYYILEPRKCENINRNLVIFVPGWPVMITDIYYFWLEHLVKRGNVVLFAPYLPFRNSQRYTDIVYSITIDAFDTLKRKKVNFNNIAVPGHSSGGAIAMNIASRLSNNDLYPPVKVIMPVEPGNGSYIRDNHLIPLATGFNLEDLNNLNENTLLLIIHGSSSSDEFLTNALNIYDSTINIPSENKNILMFNTTKNGNYELRANHFLPTSWGFIPGIGIGSETLPFIFSFIDFFDLSFNLFHVDILDYKLWYLFDALMDAAFYNRRREDALGGTDRQTFIGYWPDGSEIDRLTLIK